MPWSQTRCAEAGDWQKRVHGSGVRSLVMQEDGQEEEVGVKAGRRSLCCLLRYMELRISSHALQGQGTDPVSSFDAYQTRANAG